MNVWTEPTFQSVLQKKAQLLTSIERDSTGFNDVCRENMTFTHIFVGFPGSCHDARILRNSDLWKIGSSTCGQGHIVADGAYPIERWLLTPYRDNGHLTRNGKNYNRFLSADRVTIEGSFGLLKGRTNAQ